MNRILLSRSVCVQCRPSVRLRAVLCVVMMLATQLSAGATWSIVAVDRVTREVGSAGASCTPFVAGIVGVVPNRGVIVAQAMSNAEARLEGIKNLQQGLAPPVILRSIIDPSFDRDWREQQYGIAALDHSEVVGFTGPATPEARGDRQSADASVQGNILTDRSVIDRVFDAFVGAPRRGALADKLLTALEAGAAAGGDRRCGTQTASSAYLVVAGPRDPANAPSLRLVVPGQRTGGLNPVVLLRRLYESTRK